MKKVLIDSLKLLHPYMPFVTEEIFCNMQDEEESIMISKWLNIRKNIISVTEEAAVEPSKKQFVHQKYQI